MRILFLVLASSCVAFAVAFFATPLTARIARRFGVLDHPDPHPTGKKQHPTPVPYLGGVAIFVGVAGGSLLILVALGREAVAILQGFPLAIAVALALGFVGLIDDIRSLPRIVRIGLQIAAALAAWFNGFQVSIASTDSINFLLTVLWIVGIANAFNLLDNMDGLTAGLAGIAASAFAAMGVIGNMPALAIVAAALGGASFGFLSHNRHPAKIFMGDAGSLFLGILLALLGMRLRFDNLVQVTFLVPVVVLGIPIFDTTLVVVSRLKNRRPVFLGGRDHVSHRLVRLGLSVTAAVGVMYGAGLSLGWLGLAISQANPVTGWILLGFVISMSVFFGFLLLRVPVYEDEKGAEATDRAAFDREGDAYRSAIDNRAQPVS